MFYKNIVHRLPPKLPHLVPCGFDEGPRYQSGGFWLLAFGRFVPLRYSEPMRPVSGFGVVEMLLPPPSSFRGCADSDEQPVYRKGDAGI